MKLTHILNEKRFFVLEFARRRLEGGLYDCAIECSDWLIKNRHFIAQAHLIKGCALYRLEKYEQAEAEFFNVMNFTPISEKSLTNLLRAAIKSSDNNISCLLKYSTVLSEKSFAVNMLLGVLYSKQRNYKQAFWYFRKAKDINRDDHRLYTNIATTMLSRKNPSEQDCRHAICCLNRSINLFHANAPALYNRCRAWIKLKNAQNAIKDAQTLLFLEKRNPAFYYIHGKALLLAGYTEKAAESFKTALEFANDAYIKRETKKELNAIKSMKK